MSDCRQCTHIAAAPASLDSCLRERSQTHESTQYSHLTAIPTYCLLSPFHGKTGGERSKCTLADKLFPGLQNADGTRSLGLPRQQYERMSTRSLEGNLYRDECKMCLHHIHYSTIISFIQLITIGGSILLRRFKEEPFRTDLSLYKSSTTENGCIFRSFRSFSFRTRLFSVSCLFNCKI